MNKINDFLISLKNDSNVISILNQIKKISREKEIFPEWKNIFKAFELTDINKVKIVIFGQDPYYQLGVADGLAFSTKNEKTPASLKNIFYELKREYPGIIIEKNDLTDWAKQGVLLLNTTLTVEKNKPNSHKFIGWDYVIKKTIEYINLNLNKVIFLLWGNDAKSLTKFINSDKHYVLSSPHPSPFSASFGFFGNNHFIKANDILIKNNKEPINWNLRQKKE